MQAWVAWMKSLTDAGNLKDPGQPLEPQGKVVRNAKRHRDRRTVRGSQGLVGGFTLVEAENLDEASRYSVGLSDFRRRRNDRSSSDSSNMGM